MLRPAVFPPPLPIAALIASHTPPLPLSSHTETSSGFSSSGKVRCTFWSGYFALVFEHLEEEEIQSLYCCYPPLHLHPHPPPHQESGEERKMGCCSARCMLILLCCLQLVRCFLSVMMLPHQHMCLLFFPSGDTLQLILIKTTTFKLNLSWDT